MKQLVLTIAAFFVLETVHGQLTFNGELRPRAEFRHGYQSVADTNQAAAFSIDQRTRINVGYNVDDYEFYVTIQDVRTWGSQQQLVGNQDMGLSIHQAWAKIKLNKEHGLKLGRQELVYDDHRILGNVGWAQQARSHDAALYQFKNEKTRLDIGIAFNQMSPALVGTDYTLTKSYRDLHYIWFNQKIGDKIQMSLLAMNVGQQVFYTDDWGDDKSAMKYIATFGTHIKFNFGKFKMNLNGFYQMGSAPTWNSGFIQNHSGYMIGLDANYKVSDNISAGFGYEAQSGTTQTDTTAGFGETSRNFNPFFGTNHKFNGLMDYFYVGSGHGNVGLQDIFVRAKYKQDKWAVGADVHIFMNGLGVEVYDGVRYGNDLAVATTQAETDAIVADQLNYTLGSMLGTEIDLSFMYKIKKTVTLKAGYSHMLASETLASLKGTTYTSGANAGLGRTDQINNWGYVMIIFKPTFLSKEKKAISN